MGGAACGVLGEGEAEGEEFLGLDAVGDEASVPQGGAELGVGGLGVAAVGEAAGRHAVGAVPSDGVAGHEFEVECFVGLSTVTCRQIRGRPVRNPCASESESLRRSIPCVHMHQGDFGTVFPTLVLAARVSDSVGERRRPQKQVGDRFPVRRNLGRPAVAQLDLPFSSSALRKRLLLASRLGRRPAGLDPLVNLFPADLYARWGVDLDADLCALHSQKRLLRVAFPLRRGA